MWWSIDSASPVSFTPSKPRRYSLSWSATDSTIQSKSHLVDSASRLTVARVLDQELEPLDDDEVRREPSGIVVQVGFPVIVRVRAVVTRCCIPLPLTAVSVGRLVQALAQRPVPALARVRLRDRLRLRFRLWVRFRLWFGFHSFRLGLINPTSS